MKQLETTWVNFYMEMADLFASKSKDPKTKVGAVIVSKDNNFIAGGYNGFVPNVPDEISLYNNSNTKSYMVCHAEQNALDSCTVDIRDSILYTTHFPCSKCAISIVNKKVKHVVTRRPTQEFYAKYGGRYTEHMFYYNYINLYFVITNNQHHVGVLQHPVVPRALRDVIS